MPVQSKADLNVALKPGGSRYNVVNSNNFTWVYHKMAAGQTMAGEAPTIVSTPVGQEADPVVVKAGRAEWQNLVKGGLFTLPAAYKRGMICEAVDNAGSATITIVDSQGSLVRPFPTSLPCRISAGEMIKASGGAAGGKVGFLLRFDQTPVI